MGNNLEHPENKSNMDEEDIVDVVNALLNLGVGDPYRLEHIKQSYIENKTIWVTDQNYLQHMKEKYLVKRSNIQTSSDDKVDKTEDEDKIHCWKCGKKTSLGANFCMVCGASLFEVATDSEVEREPIPTSLDKPKSINLKIPIMIGIPVLILAIIGGAYSQGAFDNTFERNDSEEIEKIDTKTDMIDSTEKIDSSVETHSKCGPGTILKDGACVLEDEISSTETVSSTETNSKCGAGTVFNSETNSCVVRIIKGN